MENSFLMLFLHYDVPEYPNPRWPPDAILKNSFFTLYHGMLCNVYIGVFLCVCFQFSSPKISKSKMAARRHFENQLFLKNAMLTTFYAFSGMQIQFFIVFWQFSTQI